MKTSETVELTADFLESKFTKANRKNKIFLFKGQNIDIKIRLKAARKSAVGYGNWVHISMKVFSKDIAEKIYFPAKKPLFTGEIRKGFGDLTTQYYWDGGSDLEDFQALTRQMESLPQIAGFDTFFSDFDQNYRLMTLYAWAEVWRNFEKSLMVKSTAPWAEGTNPERFENNEVYYLSFNHELETPQQVLVYLLGLLEQKDFETLALVKQKMKALKRFQSDIFKTFWEDIAKGKEESIT